MHAASPSAPRRGYPGRSSCCESPLCAASPVGSISSIRICRCAPAFLNKPCPCFKLCQSVPGGASSGRHSRRFILQSARYFCAWLHLRLICAASATKNVSIYVGRQITQAPIVLNRGPVRRKASNTPTLISALRKRDGTSNNCQTGLLSFKGCVIDDANLYG